LTGIVLAGAKSWFYGRKRDVDWKYSYCLWID